MSRVYNFSAGPSMLPEEVLKKAASEMLDYEGSGQSVMEMSHRSKVYDNIIKTAERLLRELMNIPDNYKVLFLQGGASTQFAAIPLNFMNGSNKADYVITGQWAKKAFAEAQKVMPGIAVLGLAFVVGGVVSSQGSKFFTSGVVIFAAVLLHNGLGYLLGYGAGKLVGMNTAKKRTISIEVGMQNAGLATNLATTTAQFASTPESAIICAVSCTWHSISGTLLAGAFALKDKMAAKKAEEAAETKTA